MSLPSHDRKSDRDGVNPPLWSHEAPAGSVDVSLLPADAGSSKLAQTPVCLAAAGLVIQQMFSVVLLLHLQEALPPCAPSAPLVIFMDSGFSISV